VVVDHVEATLVDELVGPADVGQFGHALPEPLVLGLLDRADELGAGTTAGAGAEKRHVMPAIDQGVDQAGDDQFQAAVPGRGQLVPGGYQHRDAQRGPENHAAELPDLVAVNRRRAARQTIRAG
jgi:hypothetical protein